jgi:hypothetical protein
MKQLNKTCEAPMQKMQFPLNEPFFATLIMLGHASFDQQCSIYIKPCQCIWIEETTIGFCVWTDDVYGMHCQVSCHSQLKYMCSIEAGLSQ